MRLQGNLRVFRAALFGEKEKEEDGGMWRCYCTRTICCYVINQLLLYHFLYKQCRGGWGGSFIPTRRSTGTLCSSRTIESIRPVFFWTAVIRSRAAWGTGFSQKTWPLTVLSIDIFHIMYFVFFNQILLYNSGIHHNIWLHHCTSRYTAQYSTLSTHTLFSNIQYTLSNFLLIQLANTVLKVLCSADSLLTCSLL